LEAPATPPPASIPPPQEREPSTDELNMQFLHAQLTHAECFEMGLPLHVPELVSERWLMGQCNCSDEIDPPDVRLFLSRKRPEYWICVECLREEAESDSDA